MSAVPSEAGRTLRSGIEAGEIQASSVFKGYGEARFRSEVVRDCSFTIERNKLTVMIGPSGCGKSTLIRLLAGFEQPDSGAITLNGAPITGPARDRLVLFQESALFPWMSQPQSKSWTYRTPRSSSRRASRQLLANELSPGFAP